MIGVYLASILRTFAVSLSGIFVPIYIFQLFPNLSTSEAVIKVILYFAILEGSSLLLTIPVSRLILKLGFRSSIFIGNILLAVKLGTLILAKTNPIWLVVSAICDGASIHFFWNCYHLTFAKQSDKGHLGRQVSLDGIFGRVVSAIGPAFGGMVATLFGFNVLLTISLSMIIISSFPLAYVATGKDYKLGKAVEIVKGLLSRKFRGFGYGFFFEGARAYVAGIAWPLFLLAIVNGSFDYLGFITSGALLVSIIFHFYAGKFVDEGNESRAFTLGALFVSFFWLLRIPIFTPAQVVIVDSGGNMAESLYGISWGATVYKQMRDIKNSYLYVVLRELVLRAGCVWGLLIAYIVPASGKPFQTSFIFAALLPICALVSLTIFNKPRSWLGRMVDRLTYTL